MELLKVIEIKNKFHILLLKAKEQAKNKKQLENLETLNDTLTLLNSFMQHFEDLGSKLRQTRLDNSRKHLDNELLRSEVRYLKNQIKELTGLAGSLVRINSTRHKHYSKYYNQESAGNIAKFYQKDFELFGYDNRLFPVF